LEKGALSDAAFGEFAEHVVLYLHVTSHVDGEPVPNLLTDTGGRGFPYLVWLDADGGVLAPQPYEKFSVGGFRDTLENAVAANRALKAKAASDASARADWLLKLGEWGALSAADADAGLADLAKTLTDEQRAKLENRRNNAELIDAVNAALGSGARSMEAYAKAAPAVLKLRAKGHVPTDETGFTLFRNVLIQHAKQTKDVKLFREVLEMVRTRYAANDKAIKQIVEPLTRDLEKLEAEAKPQGGG
jgi:hypothetical protein